MENIKEKVGDRIRTLRKKLGLTQEKLGEKADLSYKFIGEIERGEKNPSLLVLSAVAHGLEMTLGDLFREEEDLFYQLPLLYQLPNEEVKLIKEFLSLLDKIFSDPERVKNTLSILNKIFSVIP